MKDVQLIDNNINAVSSEEEAPGKSPTKMKSYPTRDVAVSTEKIGLKFMQLCLVFEKLSLLSYNMQSLVAKENLLKFLLEYKSVKIKQNQKQNLF